MISFIIDRSSAGSGVLRLQYAPQFLPHSILAELLLQRSELVDYFQQPNLDNQIWLLETRRFMEDLMNKPATKELTERELMHVFWHGNEMTAADAWEKLAASGVDRAYVTMTNLVRILVEKEFLRATNDARPFSYEAIRTFDDVSGSFIVDVIKRVFGGSREKMLAQLLGGKRRLTAAERRLLEQVLEEQQ
jgi:BlaI family penicillinase repressor